MKYGKGVFAGAVTAVLGIKTAAAQFTDTASAGNGGVATASGNGGAVSAGDINSGGNVGSAIAVGDTYGPRSPGLWWRHPEPDRVGRGS